jgi:hypothetical protein
LKIFSQEKRDNEEKEKIFNTNLLSWQEVKSPIPWSPRDSHAVVVYQDKMWLMGD